MDAMVGEELSQAMMEAAANVVVGDNVSTMLCSTQ